jgi:TfoX/Sxy family transcriptional regulator of competence genes
MSHDEDLANRVRELLADADAVTEKRLFGGLAFLINGNMSVAVRGRGGLLVRVGTDALAAMLGREHAETAIMRGREMPGWIVVAPEGVSTKRQLERWVRDGVGFARTLPAKG